MNSSKQESSFADKSLHFYIRWLFGGLHLTANSWYYYAFMCVTMHSCVHEGVSRLSSEEDSTKFMIRSVILLSSMFFQPFCSRADLIRADFKQ